MECAADEFLQQLVWHMGCGYTLLAVHMTAGLSRDFPLEHTRIPLRHPLPGTEMDRILQRAQTHLTAANRGILNAGVMGLGKTVQAVVACMLRNAIASDSNDEKPTIIVGPNGVVLKQWFETLIKAGVNQVLWLSYQPISAVRSDWVILVVNNRRVRVQRKHL
jgi:hypothetical protein